MIYTLTTVIGFGKHRSKTIQEIIDQDPTYITWCLDTIDNFELDDDADEYLDVALDEFWDDDRLDNDWGDGHPLDYGDR